MFQRLCDFINKYKIYMENHKNLCNANYLPGSNIEEARSHISICDLTLIVASLL